MDSANFLIYFFSDFLAKMKSWFYVIVLVHAISLCIIFLKKDNLQTAIKICLQNSRFKFPIINLGGFDCFWLLFIVRESIKNALPTRGQNAKIYKFPEFLISHVRSIFIKCLFLWRDITTCSKQIFFRMQKWIELQKIGNVQKIYWKP